MKKKRLFFFLFFVTYWTETRQKLYLVSHFVLLLKKKKFINKQFIFLIKYKNRDFTKKIIIIQARGSPPFCVNIFVRGSLAKEVAYRIIYEKKLMPGNDVVQKSCVCVDNDEERERERSRARSIEGGLKGQFHRRLCVAHAHHTMKKAVGHLNKYQS